MSDHAPMKVLVAGGGPAAIEAVLALRDLAPDVHVDLLAPQPEFVYRPLSVLEPFARPGARRYPLADLPGESLTVRHDALAYVDVDARHVLTPGGETIGYDALLVATGAGAHKALEHALTFTGPSESELMHGLVQDLEGGYVNTLTFVAPAGATWTLPLYELALQTAERASDMCLENVRITLVSHEAAPLEVFGDAVSQRVGELLQENQVRLVSGTAIPGSDRIIVLPEPAGLRIPGLPVDAGGFLPVDDHGRVIGVSGVWAAGDGTDVAIKQGGLATQLADVAVRSILAAAGRDIRTEPFSPVLRALLIAGRRAWFMRRRLDGIDPGTIADRPLWWPPTKIAGQYLAPYLDAADIATHQPTVEREYDAARRRAEQAQDDAATAGPLR